MSVAEFCATAGDIDIFPASVKQAWGNSAGYSPDGKRIVTGSSDGTLVIWDTKTGSLIRSLGKYSADPFTDQAVETLVHFAKYSPDGKYILTNSGYNGARILDAETGEVSHTFAEIFFGMQRSEVMAISPNGSYIAGFASRRLNVWETGTWNKVLEIPDADGPSLIYSPDGKYILCGSPAGIAIYDSQTGQKLRDLPGAVAMSMAYSPDGRRLVSGSGLDVKIWNTQNWREIRTLAGPGALITSVAYSPDGSRIAAAGYAKGVKIWEAAGKEICSIQMSDIALSLSYSPDSKYIAAALTDGTVRILRAENGQEAAKYVSYDDGEWLCITPDGSYNASPQGDKYLNVVVDDEVYSIDQYRHIFYQPDRVRAWLAGNPETLDVQLLAPPTIVMRDPSTNKELDQDHDFGSVSTERFPLSVSILDQSTLVQTIKILVNGRLVGGRELSTGSRGIRVKSASLEIAGEEENTDLHFAVDLDPGPNKIEVVAFNGIAESRSSVTVTLNLQEQQSNLPNLWILALGINDYRQELIPDLNYCVNDAQEIIKVFKMQEGKRYGKVNSLLIADGEPIEPTTENIRTNLRFFDNAGTRDVTLLFLAGHGVNEGDNFYFLPNDAAFTTERLLDKAQVISSDDIYSVLDAPGNRLVFIDACHSEGIAGSKTSAADNNRLTRVLMESNAVIFTSSTGTEVSQERQNLRHGVFTYGIIQALERNTGRISMMRLSGDASMVVTGLTGNQQHPTTTALRFVDFIVAQTGED
jgi:WD40 repeat protein